MDNLIHSIVKALELTPTLTNLWNDLINPFTYKEISDKKYFF